MFLSYEHIKDFGYDEKTKKYRYQYKIIDTDFEEIVLGDSKKATDAAAFIETYRKRNLPVVSNLIRCMQYTASYHSYWTIEKQIEYHRKHNPFWSEYEDEINKYLLIL